ncbi:MAG TPA: hypothetical protein VEX38_00260, partial [Fimbriimonadaceae bacterium]|nr:hypothetical protein [Fimbriimonadaceae bacterium]
MSSSREREEFVLGTVRDALNQREFSRWISEQPPEMPLGVSSAPGSCPIAKYLFTKCGVEAEVDNEFASVRGVGRVFLPLWAQRFVLSVDLLGGIVDADLAGRVLDWHQGLHGRRLSRGRVVLESALLYLRVHICRAGRR